MKKILKQKKNKYILFFILFLAAFFRFYNFSVLFHFGMDQEYEALLVKNIVTGKHFPLIGVNAGDTGLYLGPLFLYFAAIPFLIFGGNPLGWGVTASLIGVCTVYLVYRVAKAMFSAKVAIFSSCLYAASFLVAFYERRFWNPSLLPFFSLLIGFFLYRVFQGKPKNFFFLLIFFALSFHIHFSLLVFLPLIFYAIWLKRKIFSQKIIYLSLFVFFLIQIPILAFEIRHNFLNTKTTINLVFNKNNLNFSLDELKRKNSLFISTLGRFFWVPLKPDVFIESGQCRELSYLKKTAYPEGIAFIIIGILVFLLRYRLGDKFSFSSKFILSLFFLSFFAILFYPRTIFEYYLLFLFPWLAIILGKSLDFLWERKHGKLIVFPMVFSFLSLNFLTLITAYSSYSYIDKKQVFQFLREQEKLESYRLEVLGNCPKFGGYHYLAQYFLSKPEQSYMDDYFSWIYKTSKENKTVSKIVLLSLIDSRDKPEEIRRLEEEKMRFLIEKNLKIGKKFGNISVFLFDN